MDSWHSYPSIFALGHRAIVDLFCGPVLVEEKVDGSQFSFGRFNGELKVRSKGKVMLADSPEKMFSPVVESVSHARWAIAVQHLRELGQLEGTPLGHWELNQRG